MAIGTMLFKKYLWLQLVFVILAGTGVYCYLQHNGTIGSKQPRAVQGVMDLSGWDLTDKGIVKLDGQWEFFWQQYLEPSQTHGGNERFRAEFVSVPGNWNKYQHEGYPNSDGFATYRLNIKLREAGQCLAVKVPDVNTSYNLYINGQLVGSAGIAGRTPAESKPQYLPRVVGFYAEKQEVEIVVQVANFVHHKGGIKSSLQLGSEEAVHKLREKQMGFELFLVGVFLIMAVYHFGLYLLRTSDKPALYFGIFCLLITSRTISTGEMVIMEIFPSLEWELLMKIEYLSYYLSVPVFVKFIYYLYEDGATSRSINTVQWIGILFSILVILTPVKFFAKTLVWYDGFTLLAFILVGKMLAQAITNKTDGAVGFALGVVLLLATVMNDMMFANGVIATGELVPLGLFVFIFFQALALSTRFAQAYYSLATLSAELRYSNEMLKEQVRLLDLDPDYTIERNLAGVITFWNHGAEIGYGWTKEEAVGKQVYELLQTQYPQPLSEINQELRRKGRWMGELVHTRRDGSQVVVRSCWLLKRDVNGGSAGVLELNKDITEQKNIEKQMARMDQLDLIGQMAASISHEVRNPMTTVRGFLQWLGKKENNQKKLEYYDLMISELDRANEILTEYLAIARPRCTSLELQDINPILVSIKPLLEAEAHKISKIIVVDLEAVPNLIVDGSEFRQLVLNLCRNGLEAMSDKGKILTISTFVQGEEVVLSVKDEGSGIPAELIDKLGTPFLSMKDNGTGLGLAVCYGIVARHRASIEVNTGPEGTTFSVKFRICQESR